MEEYHIVTKDMFQKNHKELRTRTLINRTSTNKTPKKDFQNTGLRSCKTISRKLENKRLVKEAEDSSEHNFSYSTEFPEKANSFPAY